MEIRRNPTRQHIKALLRKNWILFKRSLCCSCCEILLPIIFAFLLLAIRSRISKNDIPQISYLNDCGGLIEPYNPSRSVSYVALAPKNEFTMKLSEKFKGFFSYCLIHYIIPHL